MPQNKLAAVRHREGVSVRSMGSRLKMSKEQIAYAESLTDRELTVAWIKCYAKALDLPLSEFFDEDSPVSKRGHVLLAYKYCLSIQKSATGKIAYLASGIKDQLEAAMPSLKPSRRGDSATAIKPMHAVGHRRSPKDISPIEEKMIPTVLFPNIESNIKVC